jgi:hypothetical protein
VQFERAQRLARLESRLASAQHVMLADQFGRPRLLQVPLQALEATLRDTEVGQDELVLHGSRIGFGPDGPRRVRNRRLAEGADHVNESVGVAERYDIQQRLCGGPAGPREIGELNSRRNALLAGKQCREPVEAAVRHPGHAHMGLQSGVAAPSQVEVSRHQLEEGGLASRR